MICWHNSVLVSKARSLQQPQDGSFLVPGGLSALLYLLVLGSRTCTSSSGTGHATVEQCTSQPVPNLILIPLLIAFVIAGIATPIFLARRATATRAHD